MTSMLEQAVLDAAALKEVALKNAEQMVLERYAPQIKEAVQSLLEQDDELLPMDDPTAALGPPIEDPLASDLPLASTDGENACPCPDEDEEIEIDFDELAQLSQASEMGTEMPGQMGELPASDDEFLMEQEGGDVQVPAQLGPSLHLYHMSMGDPIYKVGSLAYSGKPVPRDLLEQAIGNLESYQGRLENEDDEAELQELIAELQGLVGPSLEEPAEAPAQEESATTATYGYAPDEVVEEEKYEEELELDEELYNELFEILSVDMNVVPHGHPGHATDAERLEAGDIELAREQDDKVAEEKKELDKALKERDKLQQENKSLKQKISALILENKNFKSIALQVSQKLEQLNTQNAKLAYKNRVLESDSLNERQKIQIAEAISKVGSVNEAKVVFETLNKSFTTKDSAKSLPRTLNEAIQKNSTLTFRSKESTNDSSNPQKERMQKLAGIFKKE